MNVREVRVEDAEAIVRLGRVVDPDNLATEESFYALLTAPASPQTERLVAELDGEVVAWAPSGIYGSGSAWFWVGVLPGHRRQGIGGDLYARIEERLATAGATSMETMPNDDEGRRFLEQRGFESARTLRCLELDPRTVPAEECPDGVDVRTLAESMGDVMALYELYVQAREDVPSTVPKSPLTFDEWKLETIDAPLFDRDASVVLYEGDEPVAIAWMYSDRVGGRAQTLMAATRRDRRGRGLATLAKVESSRRAADLGIKRVITGNDEENAPILAINRKLGFEPTIILESLAKKLV